MILLWKAVVLVVGVQGLQAYPKKFLFAENLGKRPENRARNEGGEAPLEYFSPFLGECGGHRLKRCSFCYLCRYFVAFATRFQIKQIN